MRPQARPFDQLHGDAAVRAAPNGLDHPGVGESRRVSRTLKLELVCGEFNQERVYGIAWQSKEFSGGFVDFLLGRGGRDPR
jgi:hypothetical protein